MIPKKVIDTTEELITYLKDIGYSTNKVFNFFPTYILDPDVMMTKYFKRGIFGNDYVILVVDYINNEYYLNYIPTTKGKEEIEKIRFSSIEEIHKFIKVFGYELCLDLKHNFSFSKLNNENVKIITDSNGLFHVQFYYI